jgi:hypothetical protein
MSAPAPCRCYTSLAGARQTRRTIGGRRLGRAARAEIRERLNIILGFADLLAPAA